MRYWLFKSEPSDYSIDDLEADGRDLWTGIRNYQARNFMRDEMSLGDGVLFYHSSCPQPGIVGTASVSALGCIDPTQFDKASRYYDATSSRDDPRWVCVEVAFASKFPIIPLAQIRSDAALAQMIILKRGNRLSITPVTRDQWSHITDRLAGG